MKNSVVENVNFTVGGNIISELSEKIPTYIFALNELIKNSYDAGATCVEILLNEIDMSLQIIDDGKGMDIKDIKNLFHLSKTSKKYGVLNKFNRYTQGSKGLGFLAVFKFGKEVTWKTYKEVGRKFTLNYDNIISSTDISNEKIDILDDEIDHGTKIIIRIKEESKKLLYDYFNDEKHVLKTINSFTDNKKDFKVILKIDSKTCETEDIKIEDISAEQQIFKITYDSDEEKIKYYHGNALYKEEKYEFKYDGFSSSLNLMTYKFKSNGKKNINKLFYNSSNALTPIIYINNNLFNNYDMFDPNIMANIKTNLMMNQIIGYINIISKNENLDFNSDRTQFTQNEFTESIKSFLVEINKHIQTKSSELRNSIFSEALVNTNSINIKEISSDLTNIAQNNIKNEFKLRDVMLFEIKANEIIYSILQQKQKVTIHTIKKEDANKQKVGLQTSKDIDYKTNNTSSQVGVGNSISPAQINLNTNNTQVYINSGQKNLLDYVDNVIDSRGKEVNEYNLKIKVDDIYSNTRILPSQIEECTKAVIYEFEDPITGSVIEQLSIRFIAPENRPINPSGAPKVLLSIPGGYKLQSINSLDNLIEEINKLDYTEHTALCACVLRVIFELSVKEIILSEKFDKEIISITKKESLDMHVKNVMDYINNDNIKTELSKKLTGMGFQTLKNILVETNNFDKMCSKSNLGSHSATQHLSPDDLKSIANKASWFLVIADIIISNPNIPSANIGD